MFFAWKNALERLRGQACSQQWSVQVRTLAISLSLIWLWNLCSTQGLTECLIDRNFLNETGGSSGLYLVLAGRLSPLPSYVCNYGFSTTDVSLGQYALATLMAGTPMILQVSAW